MSGPKHFGMRETPTTLSAYFILNGGLGALASIGLMVLNGGQRVPVPARVAIVAISVVNVVLALAFVVTGILLRRLLAKSPETIKLVLWVATGWAALMSVVSLVSGVRSFILGMFVLSLLILWYLLKNVNRLASEAKHAASAPKP